MKKLLNWLDARLPITPFFKKNFSEYYVPKNLNVWYVFGFLALFVLGNQLLSGLWLAMFYTPTVQQAFFSVQTIMRDVNYGWFIRYLHTTGASFFFIILYLHIFRGLLYGSYKNPRELLWIIGVFLYVLLMVEAFCGYLLPWGQLSYWGAKVVTSLFSSLPLIGEHLTLWIRGDVGLGNTLLQRFYVLHSIAIPLLFGFFVYLHLVALRTVGSNNPEGIEISHRLDTHGKPVDRVAFHPYYTLKDCFSLVVFLLLFFSVVFFIPTLGGIFLEPVNLQAANPLVTPENISPNWYLAPYYAMVRAVPDKLMGVLLPFSALLLLFLLPWLDNSPVRSMRYKGTLSRAFLALFCIAFVSLCYLGKQELTPIVLHGSRVFIVLYFAYFLLMPVYTRYEQALIPPRSIANA